MPPQVRVYQAIWEANAPNLAVARLGGQLVDGNNTSAALLCFGAWSHFIRERPLGNSPSSLHAVIEVLGIYVKYGRVLRKAAHIQDVGKEPQLQRIFGVIPLDHWTLNGVATGNTSDTTSGIVILPHSFIYTDAVREVARGSASKLGSGGILLARQRATKLISSSLNARYDRLLSQVLDTIDSNIGYAPFDICFDHVMTGKCLPTPKECPRLHPAPEDLNVTFFNNWVMLHLLVIALFNQSISKDGRISVGIERRDKQR